MICTFVIVLHTSLTPLKNVKDLAGICRLATLETIQGCKQYHPNPNPKVTPVFVSGVVLDFLVGLKASPNAKPRFDDPPDML